MLAKSTLAFFQVIAFAVLHREENAASTVIVSVVAQKFGKLPVRLGRKGILKRKPAQAGLDIDIFSKTLVSKSIKRELAQFRPAGFFIHEGGNTCILQIQ